VQQKKTFPLKIFSRTKNSVENLMQFWKAKEVHHFVWEWHLLAIYTFAVAASSEHAHEPLT
jgi:hypothetical protein